MPEEETARRCQDMTLNGGVPRTATAVMLGSRKSRRMKNLKMTVTTLVLRDTIIGCLLK